MKVFGLMKTLPEKMQGDFMQNMDKFEYDYGKASRWILDQAALRQEESASKKSLNTLENPGDGEKQEDEDLLNQFRNATPEEQQEILAMHRL